jgi:putative ABC transport system permease protein
MIDNTLAVFTGHLQVQAPGYMDDQKIRQIVPDATELASTLRQQLGLETVAVRGGAFALVSSADRSFGLRVMGVQPGYEAQVSTLPGLIQSGRYLQDDDTTAIVIGTVLARNLQVDIGEELTLLGSGLDGSFAAAVVNIVGIYESGIPDIDRAIAEIPLATFQDTFYMQQAAHEVVILTPDLSLVSAIGQQVQALLPADQDLVVHDWDALQPGLQQAIKADLAGAWFMYGILVILVAFSVLNTVLMSVLERTREFGIVMALGLTPGRLGRLVVLETLIMGLLGLFIGVALGAMLTLWVGYNGFSYPGMEEMAGKFNVPDRIYPSPTWVTLFIGPSVVFIGTMLASLYPALRLRKLHPVEAMRAA